MEQKMEEGIIYRGGEGATVAVCSVLGGSGGHVWCALSEKGQVHMYGVFCFRRVRHICMMCSV